MARIILGSYMVRYPLGGNLSWALQYLVGFQRLGHEVYFVEKSGYPNSCYDPSSDLMTDDCSYGIAVVSDILRRIGLGERWCYVDAAGTYHGLGQNALEEAFAAADLFVDMGTHGTWMAEAAASGLRVLIDAEPGMRQMKMQNEIDAGAQLPQYDAYYSKGRNLATGGCMAPLAGRRWRPMFHPVATDLFRMVPPPPDSAFTTVMNWQAYERVLFRGTSYGHKDIEFEKFIGLPRLTSVPLEVAVSGRNNVPRERLRTNGWRLRDAHNVTRTIESYTSYIEQSLGEFTVCKNGFVATNTGWFSDRSAAYLASGRPVVMQETGFSAHLPTGRGLFAVNTVDEAAAALEAIAADYDNHSKWAHEIAATHLEATVVLERFLDELEIESRIGGRVSRGG